MTPAELLEQAAEKVRAGWCQGISSNDRGQLCADGAMTQMSGLDGLTVKEWLTTPDYKVFEAASAALLNHVREKYDKPYTFIPEWNDESERTQEQVVEAMLQTAKDLRNQEVTP